MKSGLIDHEKGGLEAVRHVVDEGLYIYVYR
jgi:hypothetical protein